MTLCLDHTLAETTRSTAVLATDLRPQGQSGQPEYLSRAGKMGPAMAT